LIRFVCDPDGKIVPDVSRKLPGRGVWVSASRAAVSAAVATDAFSKSLKRKVAASADLPGLVEELLTRRALASLSLANKAGLVVAGFVKVESAVAKDDITALLHAAEAAPDGIRKLDRKYTTVAGDIGREPIVFRHFKNAELSLALGRENVVHAAVKRGGAGDTFVKEAKRLVHYGAGPSTGAGQMPRCDVRVLDTGRE